jgi:hypothetical protein
MAYIGALTSIPFRLHHFRYIPPPKGCIVSEIEKPIRTWQEIAEEASREHNRERLQKLSEELERALDERAKRLQTQATLRNEPL